MEATRRFLESLGQLVYCLEDVKRAASLGIRSVLLADEGALWVAGEMRQAGILPEEMQFKIYAHRRYDGGDRAVSSPPSFR